MNDLISKFLKKDVRALSRLITLVESSDQSLFHIMKKLFSKRGHASIIGITGPPGSGKSTLVNALICEYRKQKKTLGIVAVDPSSQFTGGAVLGDRIRMQDHSGDPHVYIRSMSTKGAHGGISFATRHVVNLLDAFGKDIIIVETVGVGQTEVDVAQLVDTTILVLVPESGDAIQTLKAGVIEAADIFVVNKADREGAMRLESSLKNLISLVDKKGDWEPPVLLTNALAGKGIGELINQIQIHNAYIEKSGLKNQKRTLSRLNEFEAVLFRVLRERMRKSLTSDSRKKLRETLLSENIYDIVSKLLKNPRSIEKLIRKV